MTPKEQKIKNELEKVNNLDELINLLKTNYETASPFDWQTKFKMRYFGIEFLKGLKLK